MTLKLRKATPGKTLLGIGAHWVSCGKKTAYRTEAAARAVGQRQLRSGNCPAQRLFIYPCIVCRDWHLTRTANAYGAITADTLNTDIPTCP